ncbi:MAG: LysM peptidoglycan-binding domain-containing protein [Alphaproteobacteria bacterium]|nr:LysM peptidoglycan-binding domain-containing protein [Alphaproteobacteria bacterium]
MIAVDPISVPQPGNLTPEGPEDFDFQQSSRQSNSEQPVPLGGVPRALREAAEMSGIDPLSELYNEALRYAQEGHLRLARERLQMLLCMAPDDGESRLMLARVHVAGQRWQDALSALDEAANCGVDVPMSLRRAVEDHIQAENAAKEEQTGARIAREQGEMKTLRQEARRLRTENAQVVGRVGDLEREVRKWAWATAGVSLLAIGFVVTSLLFGGGSAEPDAAPEGEVAAAEEAAAGGSVAEAGSPTAATPRNDTLAQRAAAALDGAGDLDGATLELALAGDKAILKGEVLTYKQRRAAERSLANVEGLSAVDSSGVTILARTRGTTHVVDRGDTLSHIAMAYYGESSRSKEIEQANGVTSKNLRIGQELKIPAIH